MTCLSVPPPADKRLAGYSYVVVRCRKNRPSFAFIRALLIRQSRGPPSHARSRCGRRLTPDVYQGPAISIEFFFSIATQPRCIIGALATLAPPMYGQGILELVPGWQWLRLLALALEAILGVGVVPLWLFIAVLTSHLLRLRCGQKNWSDIQGRH